MRTEGGGGELIGFSSVIVRISLNNGGRCGAKGANLR